MALNQLCGMLAEGAQVTVNRAMAFCVMKATQIVISLHAVQESSLAHYMHLSQREASADVVNASILLASSSEKRPAQAQAFRPPPPQVCCLSSPCPASVALNVSSRFSFFHSMEQEESELKLMVDCTC